MGPNYFEVKRDGYEFDRLQSLKVTGLSKPNFCIAMEQKC